MCSTTNEQWSKFKGTASLADCSKTLHGTFKLYFGHKMQIQSYRFVNNTTVTKSTLIINVQFNPFSSFESIISLNATELMFPCRIIYWKKDNKQIIFSCFLRSYLNKKWQNNQTDHFISGSTLGRNKHIFATFF